MGCLTPELEEAVPRPPGQPGSPLSPFTTEHTLPCLHPSNPTLGNCICCWRWCVWFSHPAPQGMAKAGGSSPTERELQILPSPFIFHLALHILGHSCVPNGSKNFTKGAPRSKAPISLLTVLWDPPASALALSFFHLPETNTHQPSNVSLMGLEQSKVSWGL